MEFSSKEINSLDGLIEMAYRWPHNTESFEAIATTIKKYFLFGYEIYQDEKHIGYSFAMNVDGNYTLDGYNDGGSVWAGVYGGRIVIDRLFNSFTDKIWTMNIMGLKPIAALIKRLGFKYVCSSHGMDTFLMEK